MQADAEDKMTTFYKLEICPSQTGYSASINYGKNRIQLDGGASRYRQEYRKNSHSVSLTWVTNKFGYNSLVAFASLWSKQNEPFLIDLIIDSPELIQYKCWFKDGLNLTKVEGLSYTLTADVEVQAYARNSEEDEIIVIGSLGIFEPLEKLVNTDLPNALEVLP